MLSGQEEKEQDLRKKVDDLSRENRKLLASLAEKNYGARLEKFLQFLDITAEVAQMGQRSLLLRMLMDTISHLLDCEGASILMLDPVTEELYFEEAVGVKGEEVKKFRLPRGEGLAGFVAATGEPLALSDAQTDYRLRKDIGKSIGYETRSLLAVPLIFQGQTLGVVEAINKKGNRSFTPQDIKTLTLLANLSAAFVRSGRLYDDLYALFLTLLRSLSLEDEHVQWDTFTSRVDVESSRQVISPEYLESVKIAALINEISGGGDKAKSLCRKILEDVRDYMKDGESCPGNGEGGAGH